MMDDVSAFANGVDTKRKFVDRFARFGQDALRRFFVTNGELLLQALSDRSFIGHFQRWC